MSKLKKGQKLNVKNKVRFSQIYFRYTTYIQITTIIYTQYTFCNGPQYLQKSNKRNKWLNKNNQMREDILIFVERLLFLSVLHTEYPAKTSCVFASLAKFR